MTVKELKEELDKYDDNLIVYVPMTMRNKYCAGLVGEAKTVISRGESLYIED